MNYEETAPAADKWLHADGSVTTMAGEVILPADQNRAEEYKSRAASADKWLHPDGSVTDSAGRAILPPDEGRALDYVSRATSAGGGMPGGRQDISVGFALKDYIAATLQPFIKDSAVVPTAFAFMDGGGFIFVPYIKESETVPNAYPITDAVTAALS